MSKPDLAPYAARVVAAVKSYVAKSETVLTARLEALEARLTALPAPERGEPGPAGPAGKDADVEAVRALVAVEVKARVADIPQAEDGAPGRDGQPGAPGPAGRDGENGKDGSDGFSLEDFTAEMGADGRTLTLRFTRGDTVVQRDIRIPAMLYRGVWREGEHEPGDVVTWGGSAWHCGEKTSEKPGNSAHWRLMVKEGRPGKDASGARAPRGDGTVRLK